MWSISLSDDDDDGGNGDHSRYSDNEKHSTANLEPRFESRGFNVIAVVVVVVSFTVNAAATATTTAHHKRIVRKQQHHDDDCFEKILIIVFCFRICLILIDFLYVSFEEKKTKKNLSSDLIEKMRDDFLLSFSLFFSF